MHAQPQPATKERITSTTDDCWSKSEKVTVEANMVEERAGRVLLRWVQLRRAIKKNKPPVRVIAASKDYSWVRGSSGFESGWGETWAAPGGGGTRGALRLLPRNRHLDGINDQPDVPNIIHCTSKVFATSSGGDHLNESRSFHQFAQDQKFVVVHLPSVKGNRQSINVQLPTAILRNLKPYTRYIHSVRAEDDPLNKLVTTPWYGLRDRFVVAALRARSFIDSVFTRPMILFSHSNSVTRPMIRGIMDCAQAFLEKLAASDREGRAATPALDSIATAVVERFPELKGVYDKWWKDEKESLESAYLEAIRAESLLMVQNHLRAGAPFMLATHKRNLDKDCSSFSELRYAPINSDFVESCFAHVDLATRTLCGASVEACCGVAHANVMHAFETEGAKKEVAAKIARKRRKLEGGSTGDDSVAVEDQLESWDVTSYFSLPREERWVIIRDLQFNYKTTCVKEPKARMEAHDRATVSRLQEKADKHVRLVLNRAGEYSNRVKIVPCVSVAGLDALRAAHDDKALAEALRDQIRVRRHVYGVKQKDLPLIGGDNDADAVTRLMSELAATVTKPLGRKPPPPVPYPVRATHPAPTPGAVLLDIEHVKKITESVLELARLTSEGAFVAVRSARPRTAVTGAAAPAAAAPTPRAPTAAMRGLVGEEFEEDGIAWMVLDVEWSENLEELVVWYYDVDMAEDDKITEEEMREGRKVGIIVGPVEVSSVAEVRAWIRASKRS